MFKHSFTWVVVLVATTVALLGCDAKTESLTVSEVWERSDSLDGEKIRVRGLGYFRFEPYHPLQVGGCIVGDDVEDKSHFIGLQDLLDEGVPDTTQRVSVSTSDLSCEGDSCLMTCTPFEPVCSDDLACREGSDRYDMLELVGVLRVIDAGGRRHLILEDLDLEASRGLVDDTWESIPQGVFTYAFP